MWSVYMHYLCCPRPCALQLCQLLLAICSDLCCPTHPLHYFSVLATDVIVQLGPVLHERIKILFIKMFNYNPLFTVGVSSITTSTAQQITPTSGIKDGRFACVNSTVIFTCEVRGSEGIAWRSDAYIGSGNAQLGYSAELQNVGETLPAPNNDQTVANLTRESRENGALVLESTLLVVASDSQNSSVTCTNGTDLRITTFTLTVLCEY